MKNEYFISRSWKTEKGARHFVEDFKNRIERNGHPSHVECKIMDNGKIIDVIEFGYTISGYSKEKAFMAIEQLKPWIDNLNDNDKDLVKAELNKIL